MLVALGAQIALNEFVAGRTTLRLESARLRLTRWLEEATRPSCTSMLFRLRSWHETKQVEPESELHSFMCGRAISNRRKFLGWLTQLQSVSDGHEYISMLYALVADLRKPCLRMRMLQDILGLDEREVAGTGGNQSAGCERCDTHGGLRSAPVYLILHLLITILGSKVGTRYPDLTPTVRGLR